MTKDRIIIEKGLEISLNKKPEILKMVDEMRKTETIEGISRASMVRISIIEAWDRRKSKEAFLK